MAKAQTSGQWWFTHSILIPIIVAIAMFPTAFVVMILHGAVADNFGWATYGYMTYYFTLLLIDEVATVVFGPIMRGFVTTLMALRDKRI